MDFSKFIFLKKYQRNNKQLELFFDFDIREVTGRNSKTFEDYASLLYFLQSNEEKKVFITLTQTTDSFEDNDKLMINLNSYQEFCKKIGQSGKNRTQAFLAQKVKYYSEDEKKQIIEGSTEQEIIERTKSFTVDNKNGLVIANASEENILAAIKSLDPGAQFNIIRSFGSINTESQGGAVEKEISQDKFIESFSKFLTNKTLQAAFYSQLPHVQIEILKAHIDFLKNNLDKNETFITNWLDEDDGKYRKQRCLIFGLEYVDPKREGQVSSKRFDLLAEQDFEHFVIFELKSPNDSIFKIETTPTAAGGTTTEYNLSSQLARAIPEVLGYKKLYEDATNEELQKFGVKSKKPISKCVIILGTRQDDLVWKGNFERIASSLNGIELLTYNHLIDRLENIVRNLEENTQQII